MGIQFEAIEPDVWKPELEGDQIVGVLVSKQTGVGVNKSNTYHIDTKQGQKMVWGSTVLDARMNYVNVGDIVRITYKGQQTNKRGQPVNIYKVERGKEVSDPAS